MHGKWRLAVALLAVLAAGSAAAKERTWTDQAGRTMQAEFVKELDGEVTLLRAGKLVTVKLASLSEKDQQVVRDLAAGKEVADEPAPAPVNPFEPAPKPPAPTEPMPAQPAPPANPFEPAGSKPTEPVEPKPAPTPIGKNPVPIVNRVWTDAAGQQTTAKFVRIFGGNVVLSRAGKTISIPFYSLSPPDQEHVRELLTSRGQEALIPPPSPTSHVPGSDPGPLAGDPPVAPAPPPPPPVFTPPPVNNAFEEMRRMQEEARQRAAEQAAQAQAAYEQRRQEELERQRQAAAEYEQRQEEARQQAMQRAEERRQTEIVGECLKCKGSLTRAQGEGSVCPHCGITWEFEVDRFGNKTRINPAVGGGAAGAGVAPSQVVEKAAEAVPAIVMILIAVLAIGIGAVGAFVAIIVAIVRAASTPAQSPPRY
ncbi:MAG: hypothetical protein SFU86_10125 [Pirellulaceae bacterium]|nr:hypothetical protein [Pirellulaceae bacterium]